MTSRPAAARFFPAASALALAAGLFAFAAPTALAKETTPLSTLTNAPADDAKPLPLRSFGAPEDLGKPLKSVTLLSSQVAVEDGRPVLVGLVSSGDPELNVVDLRTNRLLRSFTLKEAASCWGGAVTPDGRVYLLTFTRLYRYDPKAKRVDDLGVPVAGEKAFWTLSQDEKGRVYGGTYPGGKVFRFDPESGKYDVLGDVGQEYVRSTAYYRGTLYAGTGPTPSGRIVAFDVETGAKRELPLPAFGGKTPMWVYGLDVRGDKLFGYFVFPDKSKLLAVYDLTKGAWRPEQFEGYGDLYVGAEREGRAYFQWKGTLHEVDLATLEARSTGIPAGASYRGGGWVDLRSEELPGPSLVTATGEGEVVVLNPATRARKTLPSVMKSDSSDLQAITAGPGGRVYLSGYLGSRGGSLDTATDRVNLFRMGQAEGVVAHGDRVWWGVYPGAHLFETPAGGAADEKAAPKEIYHIGEEQDRPFGVAASADWIAFGTIPNYGTLGGALTLLDRKSGKWQTHRNVVRDQSVIALALRGDRVYGATSVTGGLGIDPSETEARVFAWDIKAGKKVADAAVRLPGRPAPQLIGGLTFGPDGLLWGVAAGSVFALDPETLAVKRQRTLYPDVRQYSRFRPQFVGFGPDGLLYSNLGGRVTAIDPATLEFRDLGAQANVMTLGPDGHVYYAAPDEPMRLRRIRTR